MEMNGIRSVLGFRFFFLKYMHIHNEVLWGVRPKSDFMVYVSKHYINIDREDF